MNRKERRASEKRGQGTGAQRATPVATRAAEVAQVFSQAVWHWQHGAGATAEMLCREILSAHPNHAASLYLLGVMALQVRRPDIAVEWLGKAIASDNRNAAYHNDMGLALQDLGRLDDAIASYRRVIRLEPENSRGYNNLAIALQRLGRIAEASEQFAKSLVHTPERFESYTDVSAMLLRLNPALEAAVARTAGTGPSPISTEDLFGAEGYAAVSADPLLQCVLTSSTVRDITIERVLTIVRAALLRSAADGHATDKHAGDESDLKFRCALAQQCFVNEYVFATTPDELEIAERLKSSLSAALTAKSVVSARVLAAVASYFALGTIPDAQTLLVRGTHANWPIAVDELLTQQLREPAEERRTRETIPQLTAIDDAISLKVRQQYEENPYPRWVLPLSRPFAISVDEYFRSKYPAAAVRSVGATETPEVLIAGCGTGRHPINMAGWFKGARVLAIDLSLASLAYAQRKSRALGVRDVTYAQADILKLASVGRTFDVIDSTGVLHHLADPEAGWRSLLSLLRPNGVMRVGLYSDLARRDVVAATDYCAERGFRPSADGIRTARQHLMQTDFRSLVRFYDFFSTSECRDLLFHVQEREFTISQIGRFLAAHNLRFIGFHLRAGLFAEYRRLFPDDPAMNDLPSWEIFEREQPDTFGGMYQFWVQRQ